MAKMKSTKTYVDKSNSLFKLLKGNIDNSYLIEVLYYHVRKALLKTDFNLNNVDAFNISGKYCGYDLLVDLNRFYDNVVRSLSLALSLRAIILNKNYLKLAYNDELLFYSISSNYLSWDSHKVIMDCMEDEDFSSIYKMINCYKDERVISEELIEDFKQKTIDPGYRHHEEFCKKLAARDDYHGKTVIKNNQFFYSDIESFVVGKVVEYVGNTVFAYCENLKQIEFEGKVIFGYFPIIECNNLRKIIVPTELVEYYKTALPYYQNIVCDPDHQFDVPEKYEEPRLEQAKEIEVIDDLEIEHVYVDATSADPYVETEIDQDESGGAIDYTIIKKVFDKKATSYKFFWFLAILDIYYFRRQVTISYKNIVAKMAAYAWGYLFHKKMDFGHVDQMKKYLSEIKEIVEISDDAKDDIVEETILENYDRLGIKKILSPLLKNVPYRFLSPWIPFTTQEDVVEKSYNYKKYHGVYGIYDEGIILNAEWLEYFRNHYSEMKNFAIKELEKTYLAKE